MSLIIKIPKISLPSGAKLKEDQEVNWENEKLQDKQKEETVINISEELGISAKDIFKYLKISLAQTIDENEIIAEKKTFFSEKLIRFPKKAEVRSINHTEGTVVFMSENRIDYPFGFKGKFLKKEKDNYLFKVKNGKEMGLICPFSKTFGGRVVYVANEKEIEPDDLQGRVVVTSIESNVLLAKIAAFDPLAIIVYKTSFSERDTLILPIEHKSDFADLLREKYDWCLYLENSKMITFYTD